MFLSRSRRSERIVIGKRIRYDKVTSERSSEIEIKGIFIKVYSVVSVVDYN